MGLTRFAAVCYDVLTENEHGGERIRDANDLAASCAGGGVLRLHEGGARPVEWAQGALSWANAWRYDDTF